MAPATATSLYQDRKQYFSSNLSISYEKDQPLWIVKGKGQYLYDETGKEYLDCVNNVAHVGHCHPAVVKAASDQMAQLNTNTRYLHPNLIEYAKELTQTLPDPLNVCFFTCSGSEANDLALRLARTYTNRTDVVVLDVAYHGNVSSMIELSPYKYEAPGGFEQRPHVHKALAPDTYRGPYRATDPLAAKKYAMDVEAKIRQADGKLAAFYAESLMGCAGQIVLPEGYLKECYDYVHQAGGVCIADEVQIGFGRIGKAFWGFETQDVVPDIVTMGKPIGNGFPMAAVVTTRAIADAFANGMEYFNTFGGCTAACAVGLAVLRVLKQEKLQQNADSTGTFLMTKLQELQHPLIGNVRGLGLFIGIELVKDTTTLEPAALEAERIAIHMKQAGVLVSTDGPFHNVIKIKPPLCFSKQDANRLVLAFAAALNKI